jgi:hypothetical protein
MRLLEKSARGRIVTAPEGEQRSTIASIREAGFIVRSTVDAFSADKIRFSLGKRAQLQSQVRARNDQCPAHLGRRVRRGRIPLSLFKSSKRFVWSPDRALNVGEVASNRDRVSGFTTLFENSERFRQCRIRLCIVAAADLETPQLLEHRTGCRTITVTPLNAEAHSEKRVGTREIAEVASDASEVCEIECYETLSSVASVKRQRFFESSNGAADVAPRSCNETDVVLVCGEAACVTAACSHRGRFAVESQRLGVLLSILADARQYSQRVANGAKITDVGCERFSP